MKKIVFFACLAFSALSMSACVSSGGSTAINDKETVKQIVTGKTTKAELSTMIGEPSMTDFTEDGREKWFYQTWSSDYSAGNAASIAVGSIVPYAGMLFGGKETNKNLTVIFDKKGVVQNFSAGGGSSTSGVFDL